MKTCSKGIVREKINVGRVEERIDPLPASKELESTAVLQIVDTRIPALSSPEYALLESLRYAKLAEGQSNLRRTFRIRKCSRSASAALNVHLLPAFFKDQSPGCWTRQGLGTTEERACVARFFSPRACLCGGGSRRRPLPELTSSQGDRLPRDGDCTREKALLEQSRPSIIPPKALTRSSARRGCSLHP